MSALEQSKREATLWRMRVAMGLFLGCLCVVLVRAAWLQLMQGSQLSSMAREQYEKELPLMPRRGPILDAKGKPLAISIETDSVFVDANTAAAPPRMPRDLPPATVEGMNELAKLLQLDPGLVQSKFDQKSAFSWLKRFVTPEEAAAVAKLNLKGVGLRKEFKRFYPERGLAAQLLGIVSQATGMNEGLERVYDEPLRGEAQEIQGLRDVRGNLMLSEAGLPPTVRAGATVQTTLDVAVQHVAEESLAAAVTKYRAAGGIAVVMEPNTGAVLAMASVPTYNPNVGAALNPAHRINHAVTSAYEPGSTMKCFLMAAALAEKVIRPDSMIEVTGGEMKFGRKRVSDSHRPESNFETATEVLATSSNVGSARIGLKLGHERLIDWYKKFGFGERTGVNLPGETRGILPTNKGELTTATNAFGQGISASPLQVASALSAIANGGTLMRPYVVAKVTRADGEVLVERGPEPVREVMSKQVARSVTEMMKAVVLPGGSGTQAAIPGFSVAGKTGTAQKADPNTRSYGALRFSSFMGFAPAEAPRVAVYVAIDEPKGEVFGSKVAAPVFREIAAAALQSLSVLPSGAPDPIRAAVEQKRLSQHEPDEREAPALDEGFIDDEAALEVAAMGDGALLVPDIRGLSSREALRRLSDRGLGAELTGSGRVAHQRPQAGMLAKPGTLVRVEMDGT